MADECGHLKEIGKRYRAEGFRVDRAETRHDRRGRKWYKLFRSGSDLVFLYSQIHRVRVLSNVEIERWKESRVNVTIISETLIVRSCGDNLQIGSDVWVKSGRPRPYLGTVINGRRISECTLEKMFVSLLHNWFTSSVVNLHEIVTTNDTADISDYYSLSHLGNCYTRHSKNDLFRAASRVL